MKIFTLKRIAISLILAYFIGISLWLIRYDNASVKKNLGLIKNEIKYDIHFTADQNLAFHLWSRFGFSGKNIKITNFEDQTKAFELEAETFFIGIKPSWILVAQMKPDYLEIEKGKFSLHNLNGLNDFFDNIENLQLNHLKAKALEFNFLNKESFILTDSYLDISRFNKTRAFLNGIYNNEFFHIDIDSDSLRDVFPECRNWNIHWRSKMLGNTIEFTGLFNGKLLELEEDIYHLHAPEMDLEFVAIGGDLSKYNHFFKEQNLPDIGPYQVSFEIKGNKKTYDLNDFFFQFYNNKIKGNLKWIKNTFHQTLSGDLTSEHVKLDKTLYQNLFDYLAHRLSNPKDIIETSLNCQINALMIDEHSFKNSSSNILIYPQNNFMMRWSGELKNDATAQESSAWFMDISANDMLSKDPKWKFDDKIKVSENQTFSENIAAILSAWPKTIERSNLQPKNTSTEVLIDVTSKGVSWQKIKNNMSGKILWR